MKTERQKVIISHLAPCTVFGDVGCDHGVMTDAALSMGIAQRAVYSDVSPLCLKKAQMLLAPFGKRATGVVADGIVSAHAECDQILIAGMGGMEIIKILQTAYTLPFRLVLQPMKDEEGVRRLLNQLSYQIKADTLFAAEGKYYYLIVAEKGAGDNGYSDMEYRYGRDVLRDFPPVFTRILTERREVLLSALKTATNKEALTEKLRETEELLTYGNKKSY